MSLPNGLILRDGILLTVLANNERVHFPGNPSLQNIEGMPSLRRGSAVRNGDVHRMDMYKLCKTSKYIFAG